MRVAVSISPPARARRIAVELTGSSMPSVRGTSGNGSTVKSCRSPISRRRVMLPCRMWPNLKSSPTMTTFARRAATRTRSTKCTGFSCDWSSSKGTNITASTPVPASNSSFCSMFVKSGGADSGRTTLAGCRSKVTTIVFASICAARSLT